MSVRTVLVRYMGDPSGAVAAAKTTSAANAKVATTARTANASTAKMGAAGRTAAGGLGILNPKILGPAGLVIGLGMAASSARDFETSAISLRTQIGLTSEEADIAASAARNIGTQYGIGAQQAIDASWFIHSAGLRGATATDALEASAKAAAVGFGDVNTVADLVTSAMNAYGPANLSAAEATDILAGAIREGKAEPEELAGSMGQVLPIASEMGVEFHELAGVVAAMTRTGTNARTANIQMRQTLMDLLNPTNQAAEALEDVGLSAEGLRKQVREEGLFDALMTLQQAFEGNEEGMSNVFSNARSLMGVLDLMGANVDENAAIVESMADTLGLVDDGFEEVQDSSQFAVDQMKAAWSELMVTLGGMVLPTITNDINTLAAAFGALSGDVDMVVRMRVEAEGDADDFMREHFADELAGDDGPLFGPFLLRDRDDDGPTVDIPMDEASVLRRRDLFTGAMDDVSGAASDAGDAAADASGGVDEFGNALDESGQSAQTATERIGVYEDRMRAIADPVFDAQSALERYRDAQEEVDRVQQDSEASARDLEDALRDELSAADDAEFALRRMEAALFDGVTSQEEFESRLDDLIESMGLSGEAADIARDDFRELLEEIGELPSIVPIRVDVSSRGIGQVSGQLDRLSGRAVVAHDGGMIVGQSREVPALLERGEFVVNAQDAQANAGLLHAINSGGVQGGDGATMRAASGGSSLHPVTVNLPSGGSRRGLASSEVVAALVEYERENGSVPVRVG